MSEASRPLDHLVLPTTRLSVARERLTALGFTVAPDGIHPFGTQNCCVYFADGTFLEPLAVTDAAETARAMSLGNLFVARDAQFRRSRGDEGFSAIVFGTADARADHLAFSQAGITAGDVLDFSRDFKDAAGKSGTASFRLAFAASSAASDLFAFTCQRIDTPNVDRTALQAHANGVVGIRRIVAVTDEIGALSSFIAAVAGVDAGTSTINLGGCSIEIVDADQFKRETGHPIDKGEHLAGIVFGVSNLLDTARVLSAAGITFTQSAHRITVAPAPGQGALFAFEEIA